MIGGPPTMMPGMPVMQPMYSGNPVAPPAAWQQPPLPRYAAPPAPRPQSPRRPPVLAEMAANVPAGIAPSSQPLRPSAPATRIRMQSGDERFEPAPCRPLAIPTPEQLGIPSVPPAPNGVDWIATRQKLEALGVKCFRVDRTPAGAVSVTFVVWMDRSHPQQVESTAASEAEAVTLALVETQRYLRERSNPR